MENSRATGLRTLLKVFSESAQDVVWSDDLDTDGIRRIGQFAVEQCSDQPLHVLFPALQHASGTIDENFAIATRLRNVLKRWRGMEWAGYLDVTPSQLLERRNIGVRSLGEMLWLAYRAERQASERPPATEEAPAETDPFELTTAGRTQEPPRVAREPAPRVGDAASSDGVILASLETIVAWGYWERGLAELPSMLAQAFSNATLPASVEAAVRNLRRVDLAEWGGRHRRDFDAVAAIERFWGRQGPAEQLIADRRLLPLQKAATLDEVGREIGVSRERIRQREVRILNDLAGLATQSGSCQRLAAELRDKLGAASEVDILGGDDFPLVRLGVDAESRVALTLLRLAGPYELRSGWLVRRPSVGVIGETKELLLRMVQSGPVPVADAEAALVQYGISPASARPWIVSVGPFRIEGDVVVHWAGSMSDKAVVVLGLDRRPLTLEEIAVRIGGSVNPRSLSNQLSVDARIMRTGVRSYGLREWEFDEYTSVVEEINQEIDRQGGSATLDSLIHHLTSTFGVSEASVRAYAASARFARVNGRIQRAAAAPRRETYKSPEMTRSLYRRGDEWVLRVRVSRDLLRGSGFPVPVAFARELGLEPLATADFGTGEDRVTASWLGIQPTLGSIRGRLERLGADEGDFAFIARIGDGLQVSLRKAAGLRALVGLPRLASEMGLSEDAGLAALASAVGLQLDGVDGDALQVLLVRRLLARGEAELAALLDPEDTEQIVISLDNARFVEVKWSH